MTKKHIFYYLMIILTLVIYFWPSKYDRIMKSIIEMKEKNPNAIYDGQTEPPFPNKKKNIETKTGIDVNHNGIRDDLEIYANRISKSDLERKATYQLLLSLENLSNAYKSKDIENIRMANGYFAASRNCHYLIISKNMKNTNLYNEYNDIIEIFELHPKNKDMLEKISILLRGELENPYKIKENICR